MTLASALALFSKKRFKEVTLTTLMVFDTVAHEHPTPILQSQLHKTKALSGISLSSISKQCRLLESLGFITRTEDIFDNRQYQICLSTNGLILWEKLNCSELVPRSL